MKTTAPRPKKTQKGTPPPLTEAKENLTKKDPKSIVGVKFNLPSELKKEIKIAAAELEITQSQLIQDAYEIWKQKVYQQGRA